MNKRKRRLRLFLNLNKIFLLFAGRVRVYERAERLCVDRNHITRMERGIRACSIDLLVELSVALGVSTDYLLTGKTGSMAIKQKLLTVIEQLNQIAQNL